MYALKWSVSNDKSEPKEERERSTLVKKYDDISDIWMS